MAPSAAYGWKVGAPNTKAAQLGLGFGLNAFGDPGIEGTAAGQANGSSSQAGWLLRGEAGAPWLEGQLFGLPVGARAWTGLEYFQESAAIAGPKAYLDAKDGGRRVGAAGTFGMDNLILPLFTDFDFELTKLGGGKLTAGAIFGMQFALPLSSAADISGAKKEYSYSDQTAFLRWQLLFGIQTAWESPYGEFVLDLRARPDLISHSAGRIVSVESLSTRVDARYADIAAFPWSLTVGWRRAFSKIF